jgi:hypothetical protein
LTIAGGEDRAAVLAAAARAVLAGFRQEINAGSLRPPQHASLLLLEEGLVPFADASSADLALEGIVGGAPGRDDGQHRGSTTAPNQSAAA